jgi:hypothetical protein
MAVAVLSVEETVDFSVDMFWLHVTEKTHLIYWRMKTNVSGLNDAKFQVKTRLHLMLCIFTFGDMEFLVAYGGHH